MITTLLGYIHDHYIVKICNLKKNYETRIFYITKYPLPESAHAQRFCPLSNTNLEAPINENKILDNSMIRDLKMFRNKLLVLFNVH